MPNPVRTDPRPAIDSEALKGHPVMQACGCDPNEDYSGKSGSGAYPGSEIQTVP